MPEILVSICCTAYNHEKYIRDTLEGFVSQQTDFPFEVVINDDASTDGTAGIIREYAARYPEIIKPIYQTENQYSRGVNPFHLLIPGIRGKYIAICEGDDYWTDPHKLQRQADFMEAHPDYSLCVHNTLWYDQITGKKHPMGPAEDRDLTLSDVIRGDAFHTSSYFAPARVKLELPAFTSLIPGMEDYPCAVYAALTGKVHWFGDVMSVYRFMTVGSWSARMEVDTEKAIRSQENAIAMLKAADEWSGYGHKEEFQLGILSREYIILGLRRQYGDMLDPRFSCLQTEADRKKLKLQKRFAWAFALKSRIYNRILLLRQRKSR